MSQWRKTFSLVHHITTSITHAGGSTGFRVFPSVIYPRRSFSRRLYAGIRLHTRSSFRMATGSDQAIGAPRSLRPRSITVHGPEGRGRSRKCPSRLQKARRSSEGILRHLVLHVAPHPRRHVTVSGSCSPPLTSPRRRKDRQLRQNPVESMYDGRSKSFRTFTIALEKVKAAGGGVIGRGE